MTIPPAFFAQPVLAIARNLIGAVLLVEGVGGRIVETEAYDRTDPASHSFGGPTKRTAAMFGPPGHVYVYRSYGMHWCLNLVCGPEPGCAVLIRALEPTQRLEAMALRRGLEAPRLLCSGPGRLCQALAIGALHDGLAITEPPFALELATTAPSIAVGTRIGITKAADRPWRFGLAGSQYVSRRFPR